MELLSLLLLVIVLLGAILFLIIEIYAVIVGHFYGAPFVRSRKSKINAMLELARIKPGETVVDLGSGDGTLLIEAVRRGGKAEGVDINPFLVAYTRWRAKRLGLSANLTVLKKDFRQYSLKNADVVFLYLWPSTIAKLKNKLIEELKPGVRIVSNGFPIEGWRPEEEKDGVFLYKIPTNRDAP